MRLENDGFDFIWFKNTDFKPSLSDNLLFLVQFFDVFSLTNFFKIKQTCIL